MTVYHGVVHDNRIELEGGARLAEGARVEVHAGNDATTLTGAGAVDAEEELIRRLRAEGLLDEPPTGEFAADEPFEPVEVRGEPLSEQIIRERR